MRSAFFTVAKLITAHEKPAALFRKIAGRRIPAQDEGGSHGGVLGQQAQRGPAPTVNPPNPCVAKRAGGLPLDRFVLDTRYTELGGWTEAERRYRWAVRPTMKGMRRWATHQHLGDGWSGTRKGTIDGMSPYQFVRSNPLIYTDAFGLWSKENVEAILCKSAMGKTTIERLQKATVLKSEYVRSYKRTRAKETDPFGEWQAHDWGGMTTTAKDGAKTIHVPDSFTDEEAARLLVHEGSHTAGGGELEAYTDETTWAIESEVKSRQGFTKKDKDGKIVPDAEAIKGYVDKNYKGWYTPDPNVQWKKDKDGLRVEYGKEEEQKDWKCPC